MFGGGAGVACGNIIGQWTFAVVTSIGINVALNCGASSSLLDVVVWCKLAIYRLIYITIYISLWFL